MKNVLYTELQIKQSIWKQAEKLNERFYQIDNNKLYVIGILNGAFMYVADMVKSLSMPNIVDFMKITSYVGQNGGSPRFSLWPKYRLGEDVIILDDMLDRGHTIIHAVEYIKTMKPRSITVMTMLHKEGMVVKMEEYFTKNNIRADLGLPTNEWVYGYGLDNNEFDRNLKTIYKL